MDRNARVARNLFNYDHFRLIVFVGGLLVVIFFFAMWEFLYWRPRNPEYRCKCALRACAPVCAAPLPHGRQQKALKVARARITTAACRERIFHLHILKPPPPPPPYDSITVCALL